jgi:hypothetical protein
MPSPGNTSPISARVVQAPVNLAEALLIEIEDFCRACGRDRVPTLEQIGRALAIPPRLVYGAVEELVARGRAWRV